MPDQPGPLDEEQQFFRALIAADTATLDQVLGDDFLLIDVMGGSEVSKSDLLAVVGAGQLKFESIQPVESRLRLYASTAVITGRTEMHGRFGETPFQASSRYTHVFLEDKGRWRLVSAQGTQIR